MNPVSRDLGLTEQVEQRTLSPKRTAQLLADLEQIRELVAECLESPSDCKEALICRQIRDVSLPLCNLSLAHVVEVLNSTAQCDGTQAMAGSNRRLKAYVEVVDDVICYIESIRDGYQSDDGFLENIEEKMSGVGAAPARYAKPRLDSCPAGVMTEFLESAGHSLQEIRSVLAQWQEVPEHKPLATEFLRQLHALKGGVLVYGVEGMVENIQYLESCVAAFLKGELKACDTLFELLDRYVSRMVVVTDLLGKQRMENLSAVSTVDVEQVLPSPEFSLPRGKKLWRDDEVTQQAPHQLFSQKLPRLRFLVERASIMLDKPVRLMVAGDELEIPSVIVEKLITPLELLLWNAIDHGIESPAARVAAGKPSDGVITLSLVFDRAASEVVITVADDGDGIDEKAVRQKALNAGCVTSREAAELMDLAQMIFYPGLSTSAVVSPVSGRGMGLDVVNTEVGRLGGNVQVKTTRGEGASFILSVPL